MEPKSQLELRLRDILSVTNCSCAGCVAARPRGNISPAAQMARLTASSLVSPACRSPSLPQISTPIWKRVPETRSSGPQKYVLPKFYVIVSCGHELNLRRSFRGTQAGQVDYKRGDHLCCRADRYQVEFSASGDRNAL